MGERSPSAYARAMNRSPDAEGIYKAFRLAVTEALRREGLPHGGGPLLDITRLGQGGSGFVLRGYVHLQAHQGSERVRWLVVKAPVPFAAEVAGASQLSYPDAAFVATGKPIFVVTNAGLSVSTRRAGTSATFPGSAPSP